MISGLLIKPHVGGFIMLRGLLPIIVYICLVLSGLVLVLILKAPSPNEFIHEVARGFGLCGFAILALQPVLAARLKFVERPFGMDILSRFHRNMGTFVAVLMVSHPILMQLGGYNVLKFDQPWYIWLGKIGLILLVVQAVISRYREKLGLSFEQWRMAHYMLAPSIIYLTFSHALDSGDDLKLYPVYVLWIIFLITAFSAFVYHKLIKPFYLAKKPYEVIEVKQEAYNVWTVKLAPPPGEKIYEYKPGQFQFITFLRGADLPVEEHHWTISSSPSNNQYVSSTIKASGDFTKTIHRTEVGDKAIIEAPFGRFSYAFYPHEKDFVFIVGGIGVTPIMAMLRHMRDTKSDKSALLLYSNRAEKDIIFREELDEIQSGGFPKLKVIHILSDPQDDWKGEKGRLDKDRLRLYCGADLASKAFYVCGPPVMNEAITTALGELGVQLRNIHIEIFSL
jgi:predicted ferric reductase